MKQLLTISAFLLHLLGYLSLGEAKASDQLKTDYQQENASFSAFSFHHHFAANISQIFNIHCAAAGAKGHNGYLPDLLNGSGFIEEPSFHLEQGLTGCRSLSFLTWRRLLLFPKHHFW